MGNIEASQLCSALALANQWSHNVGDLWPQESINNNDGAHIAKYYGRKTDLPP